MKKGLILLLSLFILTACSKSLPKPTQDSSSDFDIDININMKTIDNYLNRDDVVYRDMRMLVDEANYEAIGGDSYLSGFIKGFEVVPYPYICNVDNLPTEVGQTYSGETLFTKKGNLYTSNYKESLDILESLFPKDKKIFLMCGGGGYSQMMKELLLYFDYDSNNIYNLGGYWNYEGNNKIDIKYEKDSETYYNLSLVNYHEIVFNTLHKIDENSTIETEFTLIKDAQELDKTIRDNKEFLLYVYLPGCSTCSKYTPIVSKFKKENDVEVFALNLNNIWKSAHPLKDVIKVSPALVLYSDADILEYLDSNEILNINNSDDIKNWLDTFVNIEDLKDTCDSCSVE